MPHDSLAQTSRATDQRSGSARRDVGVRGPELSRRVLAAELKQLRIAAGLTHSGLAARLDWPQAKVSKIEAAKQGVGVDAVMAITEVCCAAEEHRSRLMELAQVARRKGWWETYSDVLPAERRFHVGLEMDASVVRVFATETVPDLLQTPAYAAAQMRARAISGSLAERRLHLLFDRQRRVLQLDPAEGRVRQDEVGRHAACPRVEVVLAESTVHRAVGGPEVLAEQRRQLVTVARSRAVSVRVVPFGVGALPVDGTFAVLRFRERVHPDVVFRTDRAGWAWCDGPHEATEHEQVWRELDRLALGVEDSARFLEDLVPSGADE